MIDVRDGAERAPGQPLSEDAAEEHVHGICFKTGPPGVVGVELEWLVYDGDDAASPVDHQRITTALAGLQAPGALPGQGRLTIEPGGQVEISSAPAAAVASCVTSAGRDLALVRGAVQAAGLSLVGWGMDPHRLPARILDLPRYAAMEEFFDRGGPWGRVMMCSTASVQVCVDAGLEGGGPASYRQRARAAAPAGSRPAKPSGAGWIRAGPRLRPAPSRPRAPARARPLTPIPVPPGRRMRWTPS